METVRLEQFVRQLVLDGGPQRYRLLERCINIDKGL